MADNTADTRLPTPRIALLGYGAFLLLGWNSVLIPSLIVDIEETFDRTDADIGAVFLIGALLYAAGALGGGLSFAATLGAIIYPPLMGLVSDSLGIRIGLLGAAALGLPTVVALYAARSSSHGARHDASSLDSAPLSLGRAGDPQGGGRGRG